MTLADFSVGSQVFYMVVDLWKASDLLDHLFRKMVCWFIITWNMKFVLWFAVKISQNIYKSVLSCFVTQWWLWTLNILEKWYGFELGHSIILFISWMVCHRKSFRSIKYRRIPFLLIYKFWLFGTPKFTLMLNDNQDVEGRFCHLLWGTIPALFDENQ
jgi:hypothetical protein